MYSAFRPSHSEDESVRRRRAQEAFIARALRSSEDAQRTGIYHSAEAVHAELQRRLDDRRRAFEGSVSGSSSRRPAP
jgi:hypothetical protein